MLFEAYHSFRQIPTDGRALPTAPEPAWFGYSVGKWEGDTLVVDTIGNHEKTWLDDSGHPHSDALHIIERLRRANSSLPVMMLTAKDGAADQVKGLDVGADDYVVKPFRFEILSARVKALLRRCEQEHPEVMHFEDLSLDTGTRRAQRGDRTIDLTSTEYELLRQFLLHPRRVVAKHVLMERVWGFEVEGSSNIVEVYVKQLRQKLEARGESRLIHTFRGAGYVLREP